MTSSFPSLKSLALPLRNFSLPDVNVSAFTRLQLSDDNESPTDNCSLISASTNNENPTLLSFSQDMAGISERKSTSSSSNGTVLELRSVPDADDQTLGASNRRESEQVNNSEKKKRKFSTLSVSLTREKIEADILAMGGRSKRTTRRSKKRAISVQKKLDDLFPGLRLESVTPDDYRV